MRTCKIKCYSRVFFSSLHRDRSRRQENPLPSTYTTIYTTPVLLLLNSASIITTNLRLRLTEWGWNLSVKRFSLWHNVPVVASISYRNPQDRRSLNMATARFVRINKCTVVFSINFCCFRCWISSINAYDFLRQETHST